MFPDSQIAQNMACSRTKFGYLLCYGISPYLSNLISDATKKTQYYTLLFDESMNKELQKKQMDVHVRFWKENQVHMHDFIDIFYVYDSLFFKYVYVKFIIVSKIHVKYFFHRLSLIISLLCFLDMVLQK